MPSFSDNSLKQLSTCHVDLQIIFREVVKRVDCKVTEGYRNEADQNKAYTEGKSKLKFPYGNHNKNPSMAVDVYPTPIELKPKKYSKYYYFAGFVLGIAEELFQQKKITHKLQWGGDWDRDNDFSDQTFNDLVHFELIKTWI